jgi:hypothetical protein
MATMQERLADLITAIGADIKALQASSGTVITTVTVSASTYTLLLTDAGKEIESTNATSLALTIPPNSSVAFPVGTQIEITQAAAGQITFTPGSGVTMNSRGGANKTYGLWSVAYLRKRATDAWVLSGDVIA